MMNYAILLLSNKNFSILLIKIYLLLLAKFNVIYENKINAY
jgi:hypothetical protein